jgi:hypothetical protein
MTETKTNKLTLLQIFKGMVGFGMLALVLSNLGYSLITNERLSDDTQWSVLGLGALIGMLIMWQSEQNRTRKAQSQTR